MLNLKQCSKTGYTYITTEKGFASCDFYGCVDDYVFNWLTNYNKFKPLVRIDESAFDLFQGELLEIDGEIFARIKV
jgi:hypothetical protein